MPLLPTPPASPIQVTNQEVILGASNFRCGNGWARGKYVFVATCAQHSVVYFRITNPYNMTIDALATTSLGLVNGTAMCFDKASNSIFCGNSSLSSTANKVTVTKFDQDTFATDSEIVTQLQLGNLDSSVVDSVYGGICSDGTSVYYLLSNTDQNSWIGKFNISSGLLTTSLQLPNPAASNAQYGRILVTDGTFLYAAGGQVDAPWAARIPLSLSGPTMTTLSGAGFVGSQGFVDAAGFWIANNGNTLRVNLDMSGWTTIAPSVGLFSNNVSLDPDGSSLWTVTGTLGGYGVVQKQGRDGLPLSGQFTGQPFPSQQPNLVFAYEAAVVYTTFSYTNPNVKSTAVAIGTVVDPSITPKPPLGRGAAW